MKKNILLAEDDKTVRAVVMATLGTDAYCLFPAMTAKRAFEILQTESVDLVLLDVLLPDANGLDLIAPIRQKTNVPIIILSSKNSVPDTISGLERGVDDYVGKPFHPTELRARIESNIQRYAQLNQAPDKGRLTKDNADKFVFSGWTLNRERQQLFDHADQECPLTRQEYRLLEALLIHAPAPLDRKTLYEYACEGGGNQGANVERAVDVTITRLRKKLNDCVKSPHIIKTCRGQGYQLMCEVAI